MIASIAKVKVITNIAVHSPTYDNSLAVITGIFHVHHFMVILVSFRFNSTCKEKFPCKSCWQKTLPNFKFTFIPGKEQLNISKEPRRSVCDFISCTIYKMPFWLQRQGLEGLFNGSYQGNKFYTDPCHCTAGSGSDATAQFHHSHHRKCPRSKGHSNEPQTCASTAINQHKLLQGYGQTLRKLQTGSRTFPLPKMNGDLLIILDSWKSTEIWLIKINYKPDSFLPFRLLKVSYLPFLKINIQNMRSPFSASLGQLELSFHTRSQTLHPGIHPSIHSFACSLQFHLLHSTD